jgi:hypothetical protein
MISPHQRLAASDSVVFTELDDESVLLNVETGVYFGLNALGTRIWGLLASGATEDEICQTLLDEYEVEPDRLAADVASFLAVLRDQGLVVDLVGQPASPERGAADR